MANSNRGIKSTSEPIDASRTRVVITVKYEGDELTQSFIEQMRGKFDREVRHDLDILRKAKAV